MRNLEIVTYFREDDFDFGGDYDGIRIFENGKVIRTYGDHYHDKGRERSQGYLDALKDMNVEVTVAQKSVAGGFY